MIFPNPPQRSNWVLTELLRRWVRPTLTEQMVNMRLFRPATTDYRLEDSRPEDSFVAPQVLARSHQARAYLSHYLSMPGRTPLERVVLNLLQRQAPDGSWGNSDYPVWSWIQTALSVQTLTKLEFPADATWIVNPASSSPYDGGVSKAIAYLCTAEPRYGWGEDTFDHCQVLLALWPFRDNPAIAVRLNAGYEFLLGQVEADFKNQIHKDWYGPGFFAAALDALSVRGTNRDECASLLEKLSAMQHETEGYYGSESISIDFKIFHTAVCVMSLSAQGLPMATPSINRALEWINQAQDKATGSWGTGPSKTKSIFTGYGMLALLAFRGPDDPAIELGAKWFLSRQSPDGAIEGIEGTVQGAFCLSRVFPSTSAQLLPITELVEIGRILQDLETTIDVLDGTARSQRAELKGLTAHVTDESDRYLIRITHRAAGQIGLIAGLIGLVLTVVALIPGVWR
jgi:Squalene-hopene cyclase C-terminal domain